MYDPDGSVVTAAGSDMTEEAPGYYSNTTPDNNIEALDFVIITDNVTGAVVGQGQLSPDVTSEEITIEIGDLEDKIDLIAVALNKVNNIYPIPPEPVRPIVSVSG